jgi:hypothetical protein
MSTTSFAQPISILVGLGFPREVENIWQAYEVLNDWPSRGSAHKAALDACRAGLANKIDAEAARGLFEAFARKSGILAPDVAIELPGRPKTTETRGAA